MISPKVRAKLLWRCRRGARELDALLMPYGSECIQQLSPKEFSNLETLLDQQDPDLLAWFLGRSRPAESGIAAAIDDILLFQKRRMENREKT